MGILLTTVNQTTSNMSTVCKTCGRPISAGTPYWVRRAGFATLGIGDDGPWCGQNCIPKKEKQNSNDGMGSAMNNNSAPRKTVQKIKYGMSTRAKSVIVYSIIGVVGFCLLLGIFEMCSISRKDNKATKKIKNELLNMQSVEYQIPTVMLTGKLGDYIQISEVSLKTIEGEYAAILTFKVKCIKEFTEIENFNDPRLNLNLRGSNYPYSALGYDPSAKSLGNTIGNMKKNTEIILKTKISADDENAQIQSYKEQIISRGEMGIWTFSMDYYVTPDKGGHKLADERAL